MHPFKSCNSSGADKQYPKRRTMARMYTILETTEFMTPLKYSENGKVPSVRTKTPSPLTDSMMNMTRATKNG